MIKIRADLKVVENRNLALVNDVINVIKEAAENDEKLGKLFRFARSLGFDWVPYVTSDKEIVFHKKLDSNELRTLVSYLRAEGWHVRGGEIKARFAYRKPGGNEDGVEIKTVWDGVLITVTKGDIVAEIEYSLDLEEEDEDEDDWWDDDWDDDC